MKPLETAKEALDRTLRRAYDKLSPQGKSVHDEREQIVLASRNFYGTTTLAVKRPRVRKAM